MAAIYYILKNPYANGYGISSIRDIVIHQSTSADGWKYHKKYNKHKQK